MTFKISPSSLNLMEECPRCFWLHVVQKKSRPSGAFPSLPSGMDRVLKESFDKHMSNGDLPLVLRKHKVDAKLFNNAELLKKWRNNLKGIEYFDEENDVMLHGAVDSILENKGKLIVLDFKTRGFELKEDTASHYQNQLDLYNFLLRKNGFRTHDYSYLLFYVPDGITENGEFIFKTDLVKMDVNIENAELLFRKAIDIINGKMPESNEDCEWCKWNKLI